MSERRDFKRFVRERMRSTGESYSIARMRLIADGKPWKAEVADLGQPTTPTSPAQLDSADSGHFDPSGA